MFAEVTIGYICPGCMSSHERGGTLTVKKMLAAPAIAGVLLLGTATVADATTPPEQEDTAAEEDDSDKTGLFGLIGLLGLAGLAGLKRRDTDTRYDDRGSSTTR